MRHSGILITGVITLLAGCDLFVAGPAPAPAPQATQTPAPTLPTSGGILAPGDLNEMARPVNSAPAVNPAVPPAVAPGTPPTQQEVAGVGSGIKGRSLDDPGVVKMIAEPARAYFTMREKLIFDNMDHALQLYKASEGEGPKTHEEFMEKIINANQIKLPRLAPGSRYVYNPMTEKLLVERPVRQ